MARIAPLEKGCISVLPVQQIPMCLQWMLLQQVLPPPRQNLQSSLPPQMPLSAQLQSDQFMRIKNVIIDHPEDLGRLIKWFLHLNWVQGLEGHDSVASIHCPDKSLAVLHEKYGFQYV